MATINGNDNIFGELGRQGERIKLIDVEIILGAQPVGGAKSATVKVDFKTSFEHQGGSALPADIVGGPIEITGDLTFAYLDNMLIQEIWGKVKQGSLVPKFKLIAQTLNHISGEPRKITLTGVVFDSWDIGLELDSVTEEKLPFKAMNMIPEREGSENAPIGA